MATTIASISAQGAYAVQNAAGQTTDYTQPLWQAGVNVNDGAQYSTRPALFASGAAGTVQVTVNVDADFAGVDFYLSGSAGGAQVLTSNPTGGAGAGPLTLTAGVTFDVTIAATLFGDIVWTIVNLQTGAQTQLAAPTRLEFYWITGPPAAMFNGVDLVSVLRMAFVVIPPGSGAGQVIASTTQMCFSGFQKAYDTTSGAPHFGTNYNGGTLDLGAYFSAPAGSIVNCYDQAGVVQVFLGGLGITTTWDFMQPYGFITQTNLIGVGQCNNPFYVGNGTTPIIGINDPNRTGFGNHAFVAVNGNIADACAGPHVATETPAQYVAAAVDTVTTLSNPANTGTVANIAPQAGITSINIAPAPVVHAPIAVRELAGELHDLTARAGRSHAVVDWAALADAVAATEHARVCHVSVLPAEDGAFGTWMFEDPAGPFTLRVFVSRDDPAAAVRRLYAYLESFQRPVEQVLRRGPDALGAVAFSSRGEPRIVAWVRNGSFVLLDATRPMHSLQEIASRIDARVRAGESRDAVPPPADVVAERRSAPVGDRLTVRVRSDAPVHVVHDVAGHNLRVAAGDHQNREFVGTAPGSATVRVFVVDRRTLHSAVHETPLEVTP